MKCFAIASLCVAAVVLSVSAAPGEYVPQAYYTINENGEPSPLYYVDPVMIHRVRRAARPQYTSSSSSSSSSSSTGNVNYNQFPFNSGFGYDPYQGNYNNYNNYNNQGHYPNQGTSTFTSSSHTTTTNGDGGLGNRFGGDDTQTTGHSQTTTSHNGQFTQTTTHLDKDGKVTYNVQSGKV